MIKIGLDLHGVINRHTNTQFKRNNPVNINRSKII